MQVLPKFGQYSHADKGLMLLESPVMELEKRPLYEAGEEMTSAYFQKTVLPEMPNWIESRPLGPSATWVSLCPLH